MIPRTKSLKRILVLSAIPFLNLTTFADTPTRTLTGFGIRVERGEIQYPLPRNVCLGLFDTDRWPDAAVVENDTVKVFRNLGNGLYRSIWQGRVTGRVASLRFQKTKMLDSYLVDLNSWSDLVLTYSSGTHQTIRHEQILQVPVSLEAHPLPFEIPTLDFREVWRSGPPRAQVGALDDLQVVDIDNDGRVEAIAMFARVPNDSSRLVVYENIGNDNYRVEWDTVLVHATGPFAVTDIDVNSKKEIVIVSKGSVALLECFGEGLFRFYKTNIGFESGPLALFKLMEADIDHTGSHELVLLMHLMGGGTDENIVSVNYYTGRGIGSDGWYMVFGRGDWERSWILSYNLDVGQLDGTGYEEIILGGGAALPGETEPIHYLWYDARFPNSPWIRRHLETGLASSYDIGIFMNIDEDAKKEMIMCSGGPFGKGSVAALKHLHDTVYSVLWVDSTWEKPPRYMDTATVHGSPIIAFVSNELGYNSTDTVMLRMYSYSGSVFGRWRKDSTALSDIRLVDIDLDNRINMICIYFVTRAGTYLADLEESSPLSVDETSKTDLSSLSLEQNYPNPFNPNTTIKFYLPNIGHVTLKVFDILGRQVAFLVNETRTVGWHTVHWDAGSLSSGIYFYQLESKNGRLSRKTALIK